MNAEVAAERAREPRRRVAARAGASRSKIVSLASSARAASRCAQASVSANVGVSATAATSSSTSRSPIGSSPAQVASLSTSFASCVQVLADELDERRDAPRGSARTPRLLERSATQARRFLFATS